MISVHSSVIHDQFILPGIVQVSQEGSIKNHVHPTPFHFCQVTHIAHNTLERRRKPRGFLGFFRVQTPRL